MLLKYDQIIKKYLTPDNCSEIRDRGNDLFQETHENFSVGGWPN